jgi:5,5'-dehydrodivanillate O-demethylase oxygenase subunit
MLTQQMNDRLTKVGPGTPMGELMRRYWHPIAGSSALNDDTPTKEIRLLGEDLVLFRSAAGTIGLIEPSCPHRKANMSYGIPEPEGLRCPYHGWLFDETGACVDQPSEPAGSRFKDKVRMKAYKVEELGGLIFAYMGPEPAPVLPRYDILVWPGERKAWAVELPCNWLQCQENSLDPIHFQWLHRYYGGWVMNRKMPKDQRDSFNRATASRGQAHKLIGFEKTEYGVIKRRLVGDETKEDEWWSIGHAVLFPNILRVVNNFQFRVPLDDTHTLHLVLEHEHANPGVEPDSYVPYSEHSVYDENGRYRDDYVLGQDQTAWAIQGPISDRTTEALGATDVGIILFRRMLDEQARVVEEGGDPMNVRREDEEIIILPVEHYQYPGYEGTGGPFKANAPRDPDVVAVLSGNGTDLPEQEALGKAEVTQMS